MATPSQSTAAVPGLVHRQTRRWLRSTAWSGGPDAPVAQTLAELQASCRRPAKLSDQLTTMVGQTRAPVVGFAQSGLPSCRG